MMLPFPDLASLDDADVEAAYDRIVQLVEEYDPELDTKHGALSEIVCDLHAILHAGARQQIDSLQQATSGVGALEAPEEISASLVDAIASNYSIFRRPARRARGKVAVILVGARRTGLRINDVFKTNTGQKFYVAKKPTEVSTCDDIGNRTFIIDAIAVDYGSGGALPKDTVLTPDSTPRGFLSARTTDDFVGGYDAETNTELLARIPEAMTAKVFSTRANIDALIHTACDTDYPGDTTNFSRIKAISVIGMGDAAMTRDQHGVLPISMGGCVDIYLRCGALLQDSDEKTVEAVRAFLMHPSVRSPTVDIQVHEAIQCQLTVRLTLTAEISEEVKSDVAVELSKIVGSMGFSDTLYVSKLQTAVAQYLPHDVNIHDLTIRGCLQYPGTAPVEIEGSGVFSTTFAMDSRTVDNVALYLHPKDVVIHVTKEHC